MVEKVPGNSQGKVRNRTGDLKWPNINVQIINKRQFKTLI